MQTLFVRPFFLASLIGKPHRYRMNSLQSPPIITALEDHEKSQGGSVPSPQVFAFRQPWLARKLWLQGRVPGYSHADFLRNFFSLLAGRKMPVASRAVSIQLKHDMTRLRAFYLPVLGAEGKGHCLKIVQAESPAGERMRPELALREKLAELGTVHIPQITRSFEQGGFIYLIEEIIIGRRFSVRQDAQLYIAQGLPQMLATYKKFGIRYEPLNAHFDAAIPARLRGLQGIDPSFVEAAEKAFARNADIPVSLCHGDLLPSNMCIGADKFYLLDWDRSFEGAIALDLLRLPLKYPAQHNGITAAVLAALETELGSAPGAAVDQLTAYVALRILAAPQKAPTYLAFWRRHYKIDSQA